MKSTVKIQDASPFLFPSSFPCYASESTPQSPPSPSPSASRLDSPSNSSFSVCGPPPSLSSSIHPPADAQSFGTRLHHASTTTTSFASRIQMSKFQVYSEVLRRLKESAIDEANLPGFDDQLWAHFLRLPTRYALDVNVERAEDVLLHKRLLHMAHDPCNRPVIAVRLVQIYPVCDGDLTISETSDSLPYGVSQSSRKSIHPPPAFGSSPNLAHKRNKSDDELTLEANISDDEEGDNFTQANSKFDRFIHEVTFAADCKPKLLSQLTFLLSQNGLYILEAHAFLTTDGYSLNVFVVDGWPCEETEQLRKALEMEADRNAAEYRDKGSAIAELTHGPKIWHVFKRRKKHGAKE